MTVFTRFRQVNFSAIESLAQNLKSALQEIARLEKDKEYFFIQNEASLVHKLVKNAANSISHLVRIDLDNQKAVEVVKTVVKYLHTAYIRVCRTAGYVAQKVERLWSEAFNLLPSGTTLQPEMFAPNEVKSVEENKTPILGVIAKWFKDNAQRWAFQQQQKLDKQYFNYINNSKPKPLVAVQLCLDLESVVPAKLVDLPQVIAQKVAASGYVEFEVENATTLESSWSRGDRLESSGYSGAIAEVKGNKAKIDWDNGYSNVYTFEQIHLYGYQKLEVAKNHTLTIDNIKNLTLRAARKLASELGLPQKINGQDLRKEALIASLLDWWQQQAYQF
ncbi:hypothetical protein NOS3756_59840 (plasmid) [Nostoc sp. NIES-3756]|uniref:hypothetical protein n=1 Tax=Nostoc sp. NIES-3756 TaxID=1751286 RepID=UPI00071FCB67|nr:hypothetical protein [Nostoc sp. NIES-3756]BAT56972.1 hypothetical protein NOS3756_59840 [Nostoc sp. NIES-3756]